MRIQGKTEFHSETGTEGGHWAVVDDESLHGKDALVDGRCPWTPGSCPVENGDWHEHGKYEGLHVLRDGDRLEILSADRERTLWKGEIELIRHPLFTEDAMGLWIHADQAGTPRDEWATYFMRPLPCVLERDD